MSANLISPCAVAKVCGLIMLSILVPSSVSTSHFVFTAFQIFPRGVCIYSVGNGNCHVAITLFLILLLTLLFLLKSLDSVLPSGH